MSSYGKKILKRLIIVILSATIIAAGVLFIVFKLSHKDNSPSTKNYFDYPQSENVVSDEKSGSRTYAREPFRRVVGFLFGEKTVFCSAICRLFVRRFADF